jgi:hypothetical protein
MNLGQEPEKGVKVQGAQVAGERLVSVKGYICDSKDRQLLGVWTQLASSYED